MAREALKLKLELREPKDLLARVVPNGRLGGLVLDGPAPGPLGVRAKLMVQFDRPVERHFTLEVQVAWARHKASILPGLQAGFGVDFIPEDAASRDRLLAYAREELSTKSSRSDVRIPTDLVVTIQVESQSRKESLVDLSQGGAFIRTGMFLPLNSKLEFHVRPPRALTAIRIQSRVAWIRRTGDPRGFGVEFLYANARQARRVKKLVEKLGG